jgi:RimJ/RimL family protein N-acetyltransferase
MCILPHRADGIGCQSLVLSEAGKNMIIRSIQEDDSEQFLRLLKKLDQETQFMLFEPGERTTTSEEQRQKIQGLLSQDSQTILVAEHEHELVGFLGCFGGGLQRNRHCAYLVIGILQAHAGRGLGARFFEAIEAWALTLDIHRLELTVMTHNDRAVHLYRKMGFEIEGVRKGALKIDGKYVDEYYMAKLLNQ